MTWSRACVVLVAAVAGGAAAVQMQPWWAGYFFIGCGFQIGRLIAERP